MRIHYLQHVSFEDPANICTWATSQEIPLTKTLLFENSSFPTLDTFDWLVVMGGPMNIYEEEKYPWLIEEKKFIHAAIQEGKIVLGICLGAQLIADVLGAKVVKGEDKEIGWFPVQLTNEAKESTVFSSFPEIFTAFHWHGDTFEIPKGAKHLIQSEGCQNQAFEYNERVFALQFHLESSEESIQNLVKNCFGELIPGKYVQSEKEILSSLHHVKEISPLMHQMLSSLHNLNKLNQQFNSLL